MMSIISLLKTGFGLYLTLDRTILGKWTTRRIELHPVRGPTGMDQSYGCQAALT